MANIMNKINNKCAFSVLMQTGDINATLIKACTEGYVEMVTVLLDHGADVNFQNVVLK